MGDSSVQLQEQERERAREARRAELKKTMLLAMVDSVADDEDVDMVASVLVEVIGSSEVLAWKFSRLIAEKMVVKAVRSSRCNCPKCVAERDSKVAKA